MKDDRVYFYNWARERYTTNPDHAQYMDYHNDKLHIFLEGVEVHVSEIVGCKTGKDGCIRRLVLDNDGHPLPNADHSEFLMHFTHGHVEVKSDADIQIEKPFYASDKRFLALVKEYEQAQSTEAFGDWLVKNGHLTIIEDDGMTVDEHGNLVAKTRIALR